MKNFAVLLGLVFLAGCATSDKQVKEALQKNPKIIFEVIEENPEAFIESVNKAAQAVQFKQYEKQLTEMKKQQEEDLKNPKQPALDKARRLAGTDQGTVIVVEYADFQCPACGMGHKFLSELKQKYKADVQFYYKHMPLDFHPQAMPAAQYFEAVRLQGLDKALKFYDYVFTNQKQIASSGFFEKAVKASGAQWAQAQKDMKSEAVKEIIDQDMQEFKNFGYTGTPVVLINGVALQGAQKLESLESIVRRTKK